MGDAIVEQYERWARQAHAAAAAAKAAGQPMYDFGPDIEKRILELKQELAKLKAQQSA